LLSADGFTVTITGLVDCSQSGGRPELLRVTLTQPDSGAVVEGLWQKACSAADTPWKVSLTVGGGATLSLGPADVAVLDYTAATQWMDSTQLVAALSP
jgi:hypothetical protein